MWPETKTARKTEPRACVADVLCVTKILKEARPSVQKAGSWREVLQRAGGAGTSQGMYAVAMLEGELHDDALHLPRMRVFRWLISVGGILRNMVSGWWCPQCGAPH